MDTVTIFSTPSQEGDGLSHAHFYRSAQLYTGLTPEQLGAIQVTAWGKPFLPQHPDLHFSISHSGEWWLCAFASAPIGIDIQIHRSHLPPETLSPRFFHPVEDRFLALEDYRSFFDLWCAKESWVKFLGTGFSQDPESFSVVSADGSFPCIPGVSLQLHPFAPGYSLCLCARTPVQIHLRSL